MCHGQFCLMSNPVDALVSPELRKITCKHSGRKTLVVGSCMGEKRPAHGDSWEWWDGDPHPALHHGLLPSLQGLSTMLLLDLLVAHPQLTIYFPVSSSLSCRMKPLSLLGIVNTSVQAFRQQWACSQLKPMWLFLQRNLAEQRWVQVRHRGKWEASWLIPWHWLLACSPSLCSARGLATQEFPSQERIFLAKSCRITEWVGL